MKERVKKEVEKSCKVARLYAFFFSPSHKGLPRLENWETKFDERTTNFTDYMGKEMENLINKKKNNGNRSSLHNVVKGAVYMLSTSMNGYTFGSIFFVYSSLNDRDHRFSPVKGRILNYLLHYSCTRTGDI